MSGYERNRTRKPKGKKLSNGWIILPSKTYPDRVYFYNPFSKCSTWENPCEANDVEVGSSSSETSSERNSLLKTKHKVSVAAHTKKQKGRTVLHSPDRNSNNRVNSEMEDYDDDQYFIDVPINVFNHSHSHFTSPPSSPDSVSSLQSNISDTDNALIENSKKELWTHFVSSPDKCSMRKSVIFSDFQEPTTSHTSGMDDSSNKDINGFGRSKTKERKKEFESVKKSTVGKINRSVHFEKRDKTPAQSRLLKFRKENGEKLKELIKKYPQIYGESSSKNEKNSREQKSENDCTNNMYINQTDTCNSCGEDADNQSGVDFSEEMDWEPSNEESDVRNINVFRQQLDKPTEVSSDIFFGLNSHQPSILASKTHSWFVILDTNIFVSCLGFVKDLRDTNLPELGLPIIYVPWRVLQELDHLKDSKIHAVEKNLYVNVRKAIRYLNDNFKSRHPRVFGQSFEDFARMVEVDVFAPDDEILQTCIQLQKQYGDKKLMLLTNDKNLESKALVSGVEVHSKDRFQKKYLKSGSDSSTFTRDALNKSSSSTFDDCLCKVKAMLKDFLRMLVETEMRIAFEEDWKKMVKKPPWSLEDALKCFLSHWRCVFFLVFSEDVRSEAEQLYEQLFRREAGTGINSEQVSDVIKTARRLVVSIRKSQKKRRPYLDLIPVALAKLSDMLKTLESSQVEVASSPLPTPSKPCLNSQQQVCHNDANGNDVSKVKILFKDIWDSLRSFCCSLSDVMHSSDMNADTIIQKLRLKLTQVLNVVGELVATVEKILEVNPADVHERQPVIVHFSNFLIHVYPDMVPDLKNELTRCLAAFFRDFEGRSIIGNSLKDFREYIQVLSKAAEYFNAQYTC